MRTANLKSFVVVIKPNAYTHGVHYAGVIGENDVLYFVDAESSAEAAASAEKREPVLFECAGDAEIVEVYEHKAPTWKGIHDRKPEVFLVAALSKGVSVEPLAYATT